MTMSQQFYYTITAQTLHIAAMFSCIINLLSNGVPPLPLLANFKIMHVITCFFQNEAAVLKARLLMKLN